MKKTDLDYEIKFLEGVLERRPRYVDALVALGEAYTQTGRVEAGLKVDQRLSKICKDDPIVFYNLACSFALSNRSEEALESLDKAIALGYDDFKYMVRDPDLKSLHEYPLFQKYLAS